MLCGVLSLFICFSVFLYARLNGAFLGYVASFILGKILMLKMASLFVVYSVFIGTDPSPQGGKMKCHP